MTPPQHVRAVESSLQAERRVNEEAMGDDGGEVPILIVNKRSHRKPLPLLKRANMTTESVIVAKHRRYGGPGTCEEHRVAKF